MCSTRAERFAPRSTSSRILDGQSESRLAVLIDRGGRELPIQPDIVGKKISVASTQRVDVLVEDLDGRNAVVIADSERRSDVTLSLGKDLLGLEPLSGEQIS